MLPVAREVAAPVGARRVRAGRRTARCRPGRRRRRGRPRRGRARAAGGAHRAGAARRPRPAGRPTRRASAADRRWRGRPVRLTRTRARALLPAVDGLGAVLPGAGEARARRAPSSRAGSSPPVASSTNAVPATARAPGPPTGSVPAPPRGRGLARARAATAVPSTAVRHGVGLAEDVVEDLERERPGVAGGEHRGEEAPAGRSRPGRGRAGGGGSTAARPSTARGASASWRKKIFSPGMSAIPSGRTPRERTWKLSRQSPSAGWSARRTTSQDASQVSTCRPQASAS